MHMPIPHLRRIPSTKPPPSRLSLSLPQLDLAPLRHVRHLFAQRESEDMRKQKIMIGVIVGVSIFVFLAVLIFILNRYHGTIRFSRKRKPRGRYYGSSRYSGDSSKDSQTSSDVGPPPPPPPV